MQTGSPGSRCTILYLILILIIFILGEDHSMRDRGSVWSLDQQQQQQQQQPGHSCVELTTFYGIVSYAVGVSLILCIVGIKSGRRFFLHRCRRHSGRRSSRRSGHTLRDTPANHHHHRQRQQQQQQQQQRVLNGLDMDYSSDEFDRELEQLRDRISTSSGGSCAF